MKGLIKSAIGFIGFGIVGMLLISAISIAEYGRVYMYDGYVITAVLWTVCFISVGLGLLAIAICLKDRFPKIATGILIILLILAIVLLLKSCGALTGTLGGGNSGSKCAACGGSGLVNNSFLDFSTCPVCHGTGLPPH